MAANTEYDHALNLNRKIKLHFQICFRYFFTEKCILSTYFVETTVILYVIAWEKKNYNPLGVCSFSQPLVVIKMCVHQFDEVFPIGIIEKSVITIK